MQKKGHSIDAIIRRAIEDGKFDNLKGKGQPLKLDHNPFIDPEWRMAFDLLRKEDFALPWMEKRNDIENELAQAKQALARTWEWYSEKAAAGKADFIVQQEWQTAQNRFREAVVRLNQRIDDYNLEVPSDTFMRLRVNVEKVIEKIGAQ